jgi:hypothetical protein
MADDPHNGKSGNGSEHDRFERLLKHIVSVPKTAVDELDKKRKRRASRIPAKELPHRREDHNGG